MHDPDMDKVAALMRHVAEVAILPRFRALADHEVMEKGAGDIVTAADMESERLLTRELPALLSGSTTVGEEAHHADPSILDRFAGDAPVWVVDPLDGTRNFSRGSSTFCMLVALVRNDETRMAWILDPVGERLAMAEKGAGATLNGAPLRMNNGTEPPAGPGAMIGQVNFNWFAEPARRAARDTLSAQVGSLRPLACAGHDFLDQSQGLRHFSFYRRLWPWDHAAGVLVRREAGGVADRIDNRPYRAGERVQGLLSAPDMAGWIKLKRLIKAAGPAIEES
ncbi:inositol monophosphatase [Marivibrio halodurans]|uniref:Inositol monophosphatase n=1 Tax=Marivibrio halodurans TaxID=2039722 RepID=A0A8J7UZE2_9PROT|nr:inositol monophosphatase [Marivibrio halodurans]MBP5855586.1 inositol monophosphatase [Marivibrio halodurans]